jgi:DNA-binding MarR family transcriptional regulator
VQRESSRSDRRAWIVRMTPLGRRSFEAMAKQHEEWILELFAGVEPASLKRLYAELGALRLRVVDNKVAEEPAAPAAVE